MTTEVKLHLLPGSTRSTSVLITAILAKVPYTVHFQNYNSCKTEHFLTIHPFGKLPAAETPEGSLYESNTICRYLAKKGKCLYGDNERETLLVDQWLDTTRIDLPMHYKCMYPIWGLDLSHLDYNQKKWDHDNQALMKSLHVVDQLLNGKSHLVGTSLTIADITLVSDLAPLYRYMFSQKQRSELPHLTAYFEKWAHTAEFKQVLGHIQHPTEHWPIHFTHIKKEHAKVEKQPQPKKEEKKKEEKKKEEVEEDDVIEEKQKTYSFPETKFDLFAFKTMYVNAPNKKDALDFLLANWDENAFSFWYLVYDKLPSEGKVLFLTNNLMSGFLDRADACRKYSLGVHGVYGDEPNLEVRGVWMWKGVDILEPLKEHQQFDVYKYTKLNPKKAEDWAIISEYWTKLDEETDKVEGRTARTVKYFK